MVIFGGPKAYEDRWQQKLTHWEVYAAAPATPLYLHWFERPITFDSSDHPDRVIEAGRFPLVVSVMVENMKMTKVLMDRGSGINILYKDAFNGLRIDIGKLHTS